MGEKAPICNWELRAVFIQKEQAVNAVTLLMSEDVDFNVSFSTELDATRTLYVLDIEMPWASNLATVAGILEQVDYKPAA
jgi:hypothetical protein